MALTKIVFEIEVNDTFQNGQKLDMGSLNRVVQTAMEQEYTRQQDENRSAIVLRVSTPDTLDLSEESITG